MEIRSLNTIPSLSVNSHQSVKNSNMATAVANNRITAERIKGAGEDNKDVIDVKATNYEASSVDVRDVESAANLANRITFNIVHSKQALDAQANQSKEKVQSLLY